MANEELKKFTMRMPMNMYNDLKKISDKTYIPVAKLILLACTEYLERRSGGSNND